MWSITQKHENLIAKVVSFYFTFAFKILVPAVNIYFHNQFPKCYLES